MHTMASTRRASWIALALLGLVLAFSSPAVALAQDRTVGREAVDPKDRENLPPAVDGRTEDPEEVDPRALEEFREPLAPYGAWVEDERYGTVWVPHEREVGPDFYPYSTGGRWELTNDADWLWVSDYRWGDVPFHYGRWVYIGGRGWAWIPGRVWAPAWVVWRTGPHGYVGWAPYPPTWTWWHGSAVWLWWPPPAAYVFVETHHAFDRRLHQRLIHDPARVKHAASKTTPHRQPASPGAPGSRRNGPGSPDLKGLRYDGPQPTLNRAPRPQRVDDGKMGARPAGARRAPGRGGVAAGRRDVGPALRGRAPGGVAPRDGRPAPTDVRPSAAPDRGARGPEPRPSAGPGPRSDPGLRSDPGPRMDSSRSPSAGGVGRAPAARRPAASTPPRPAVRPSGPPAGHRGGGHR